MVDRNPKLKTQSSKDSPQQQERRGGQGGLALGTTTNRQGGLY